MTESNPEEPTTKKGKTPSGPQSCTGCGETFPSRNAIFKHLRATNGACLDGKDYEDFCKYVRFNDKGTKVVILFGYLPFPEKISNGDDAAQILLQCIHERQRQDGYTQEAPIDMSKYNRSYGHSQRSVDVIAQDNGTGAITEVLTTRLQPLRNGQTVEEWLDQVQEIVNQQFPNCDLVPLRILGRQEIPQARKFNAEMDVTRRRMEYVMPVEILSWSTPEFRYKLESLPTFSENHKNTLDHTNEPDARQPDGTTKEYLHKLKKMMQSMTTQIVALDMNDKAAVLEKGFSLQKRKGRARRSKKRKADKTSEDSAGEKKNEEAEQEACASLVKGEQHHVLRRRRFHNFTLKLMAHEYLAYRRLDRIYHRATLTFPSLTPSYDKPFLVLSFTGDLFLTGQILRVMGLFLALANGLIDADIVDCVFDESYPHLIPTPPAPQMAMMAAEASYMTWEGKLKSILSPRSTDRYDQGWNQTCTMERVKSWQDDVYNDIAKKWLGKGCDPETGRPVEELEWTENVLKPWAETAKKHLAEYRTWLQTRSDARVTDNDASGGEATTSPCPPLESVDSAVPAAFEKVLYHLRKVDASGQWPSTTLKRQLVIVSTADNEEAKEKESASLAIAHMKARNNKESRSSAYVFAEGQGGASGSFSVGLMPGGINKQPKSNSLFPELVDAAFELERLLCPDREPSSTIAINRNAQFRPHTDSGAGAGQSQSLIVGLGTYSGGELVLEGERHDIRYKAIEFDGWKQRHWVLPFNGERYSLVWFTPHGCEGMRGIDLKLTKDSK